MTKTSDPLTLSYISYDILEHIFHQVNRGSKPLKDFASIRLACRRLNQVVEPLFFRDIVINCDSRYFSITQVKTQLAALANKQCPARRYSKRLTIFSLSPGGYKGRADLGNAVQENPMFAELDEYIKSALDALVSLKSVSWHFRNADPYKIVVASLSALPLLKDVCIKFEGQTPNPFHLPLRKFSGLEKLALCNRYGKILLPSEIIDELVQVIANSPLLSHLEVTVHFCKPSISFHEFLRLASTQELSPRKPLLTHLALDTVKLCIDATTLPFLRSLTSLDISTSPGEPNSELWEGLKGAKIHLTNIKTDIVTSTFIDYLTSYSGLQKLTLNLRMMPRDTEFGTTEHVYDLFHLALPRHEDSLTVLSINAPGAIRWCIRPDLLSPLYTCQNLVELGLFVDVKVADEGDVESFGVTDMVASAANFRQLSILQIFPAGPISVWGCGTGLLRYQEQLQKSFMDNLASLKISDPERYLFQVTCFGNFFELLPDPVEVGKYRYALPARDIIHCTSF